MISVVFENRDVAFEVLQMMKKVLEEDGYHMVSELNDESYATIMKKGNSAISISYHSINPTEVRFRVEGTDIVVDKLLPRFFTKFFSKLASEFYTVEVDKELEEKISIEMDKIVDKVKKEKENQDEKKKEETKEKDKD